MLRVQPALRPRAVPGLPAVFVVLSLVFAGCSAKAPASGESRPATPEVKAAPAAPTEPAPALDPRETTLSAAVVLLLEHEHLLRKPIDDELSRTAYDTYLDRLDVGKMFLLRKDRDALVRYVDKVDDELRSGALDLAHDGERIFESRVEVVEKLVAELLSAPRSAVDAGGRPGCGGAAPVAGLRQRDESD
ncbi:MAG TPA: hypothetical protein VF516_26330, partial [Kofleriaceae bacterium]